VKPTDKPFWQALLAGRQPQAKCDVRLAGTAVADGDHVLPPQHILGAGQFQHQHLVQRRQCQEVEAVETFDCRELCLLDAPLDHPPFPLDQLQLGQPQQIADMINAVGGALPGQLVILAQERR